MDFKEEEELQEEQKEEIQDNSNDEINENEPVSESDSSDSERVEEPIKDAKAQMSKKGFAALMKNPVFWFWVGIIALIVLAAFIFYMDYDLFGVGEPKPTYYQGPACGKVFLTWEDEEYLEKHHLSPTTNPAEVDLSDTERFHYEEYDYDTYISGIVWTDNKNVLDVDNEVVYQAMGVAARSRLISELPDNCVVLRDYNEQAKSFTKLDGSEEKYTEITQAVQATKGIIIGRNNTIINARYDAFSYTKKLFEEDDSKNREYFYHMMNENEEGTKVIPGDWVDDIAKSRGLTFRTNVMKHVNDTNKFGSMSLYGAKYLLEKKDSLYELYRILETYYGRDIEYYTLDINYVSEIAGNNGAFGLNECMWWPIGSSETTVESGITFARDNPETTKITSGFGPRNLSLANASTYHKAIDIGGGREGQTNIIAAADGIVTVINTGCVAGNKACGGRLGNYVKIEHGDGIVTRYGHLYSVSVSTGQEVKQGQVIGKMGNTGNSTGPHLDFQVLDHGTAVNPLNYVSAATPRPTNCGTTTITPTGDNVETTCLAFKQAGYSSAQIAGAMVNAQSESGFRPNAFNSAGGGQGAYGIFQWRSGRQSNLKALKNYDTIEVQLGFALSELNSSEATANKKLLEATTPGDAAFNFCKYYERPGDSECNKRKNNSNVNTYYNYANNGCQ